MKTIGYLHAALKETFSRAEGWIAAAAAFLLVLLASAILSNLKLLGFIAHEEAFDRGLKVKSALQILWGSRITFLHEGGFVIVLLGVMFGLNAAFLVRYMRRRVQLHHAAGTSAIGIGIGLLGVGCAACGSVLFAGFFGVGGALAALPLHGQEFSWLGILLVIVSTLSLARKIAEPEACGIPQKR